MNERLNDLSLNPEQGLPGTGGSRLAEVFRDAPALVVVLLGPDHVFEFANDGYLALFPDREIIGRTVAEAVPEVSEKGFLALLDDVYATGNPFHARELPMLLRIGPDASTVERFFNFSYQPLRDRNGRVEGIFGHGVDVTDLVNARRLAEEQAAELAQTAEALRSVNSQIAAHAAIARNTIERSRRVQLLTSRLNSALSRDQVADFILDGGLEATGADAASLAMVIYNDAGSPSSFEIVRTRGYTRVIASRYRAFPLERGRPVSEAVLQQKAILVPSPEAWAAEFAAAPENISALGYSAFAAIPVCGPTGPIAVLSFSYRDRQVFDDSTSTFLETLGEQCALALERARLHEAELRSSERHAALLGTIQDAFVAFDREMRFTYLNPKSEEYFGHSAAELVGQQILDRFPQSVDSPITRAVRRTLATGERTEIWGFSLLANRWIEAWVYPAPDGVSVVFRDITARIRAEKATKLLASVSGALAASLDYEATLSAVAHSLVPELSDWSSIDLKADADSGEWPPKLETVAFVHRDAEKRALGEALMSLFPRNWSADSGAAGVLRTNRPLLIPEVTDEMLIRGAQSEEQLGMLRKIGFSSIIIAPLIARERALGVLTLARTSSGDPYDETDLALAMELAQRAALAVDNARLFEEAERARAEAEAANRAKSEFLTTMSHELRTPLNAIGGYVELIALGIRGPVTQQQLGDLERVTRSQQHLLGLINEVLNYAKLETGSVRYDFSAVNLAEVVSAMESLILPQAKAKGLEIEIGCGPGALAWADPDRVRQILLNLLSNAVRFTPAGGRISVDCGARAGGDLSSGPERWTFISVSDNGIGIPADKLESIFEPFVQVGRDLSNPGEGTGLGLAISRDLARAMQGDLVAVSTLGEGSTFTLTLPGAESEH